jgi:hypothetical protein
LFELGEIKLRKRTESKKGKNELGIQIGHSRNTRGNLAPGFYRRYKRVDIEKQQYITQ